MLRSVQVLTAVAGCETVAQLAEVVAQHLTAQIDDIEQVSVPVGEATGLQHILPDAEEHPVVVFNLRIGGPVAVAGERRTGVGQGALSQAGCGSIDLVEQFEPGFPLAGYGASDTAVGPGLNPFLVGALMVPCLFEDIFIEEGVHIERFEGGAEAPEIRAAMTDHLFDAAAGFLQVAGQHGVAAEIAQIAPQEGLTEIRVGIAPHLGVLGKIVEQDHLVARNGIDKGVDARVGPVAPVEIEQPGHLEPAGFGIALGDGLVNGARHGGQIFRFPAGRLDFVERVGSVDVVCAVKTGLLFEK